MRKSSTNRCQLLAVFALLVWAGGCAVQERKVELQGSTPAPPTPEASDVKPTITAAPVEGGEGGWQVASGDSVTLTVTAPGAKEVSLLYRPVVADEQDGYIQLGKLSEPTEGAGGKFQTVLHPPEDFAGEVWAQATYPDGARKQTEQIALTTRTETGEQGGKGTSQEAAAATAKPRGSEGASAGGDDSARSATGMTEGGSNRSGSSTRARRMAIRSVTHLVGTSLTAAR
jgi:hypothetical protein